MASIEKNSILENFSMWVNSVISENIILDSKQIVTYTFECVVV